MDASSSQSPGPDKESRDLKCLHDIFASNCSLEDIASAYCRANGDVNAAGKILSDTQIGKPSTGNEIGNGMVDCAQSGSSFEFNQPCSRTTSARGSKPKKFSISTGLVPSVARNVTSQRCSHPNEVAKVTKALELESKQPKHHMVATASDSKPNKKPLSNREIEDFLFSMHQEGFKLDVDKIQKVLCSCGYDGKKGLEELLELSLNVINDKDATCSDIKLFADKMLLVKPHLLEEKYSTMTDSHRELLKPSQLEDGKAKASREILEALFADRKVSDEPPRRKRLEPGLNRTRTFGKKVVSEPLIDDENTITTNIPKQQNSRCDDDDYDVLRRAVKQHRDSKKTYFEAGFDALAEGERKEKIDYLLEQGKYHSKKSRQVDELSSQKIIGERGKLDDVFTLDLHMHHSKEARSLLKCHLQSLAAIIRVLRVIVDSGAQDDITKGRRKLAVIDFLGKQQIQWSEEEGNPGTFLIQMDR